MDNPAHAPAQASFSYRNKLQAASKDWLDKLKADQDTWCVETELQTWAKASGAELWHGKSSMHAENDFGPSHNSWLKGLEHSSSAALLPPRCITESHACFAGI